MPDALSIALPAALPNPAPTAASARADAAAANTRSDSPCEPAAERFAQILQRAKQSAGRPAAGRTGADRADPADRTRPGTRPDARPGTDKAATAAGDAEPVSAARIDSGLDTRIETDAPVLATKLPTPPVSADAGSSAPLADGAGAVPAWAGLPSAPGSAATAERSTDSTDSADARVADGDAGPRHPRGAALAPADAGRAATDRPDAPAPGGSDARRSGVGASAQRSRTEQAAAADGGGATTGATFQGVDDPLRAAFAAAGPSAAQGAQPAGASAVHPGVAAMAPPSTLAEPPPASAAAALEPALREIHEPLHGASFAPALGAQLTLLVKDGITEARLQLNPAEMGPIAVQIQLDGTQARVEMVAEQALTRQALEQSMPALASALRDSGLTLAGGGVFDQSTRQGQPGREASAAGARSGAGGAGTEGDGSATALPSPGRQPRGIVDLYA